MQKRDLCSILAHQGRPLEFQNSNGLTFINDYYQMSSIHSNRTFKFGEGTLFYLLKMLHEQ